VVKQNLTEAVKALGDAVGVTLAETGEEIRKAVGSERPRDEEPPRPDEDA
jgi:hypothetical protein